MEGFRRLEVLDKLVEARALVQGLGRRLARELRPGTRARLLGL